MNTVWFMVLGALLVGYAVLDGLDLGIGTLHMFLGRNDNERRTNFQVIGPFWAGYEVWLLTAGGSMVAAFPRLYAASFSGFYIVLTLVLWLLLMRGGALEFRSHMKSPLWRDFWDLIFSVSSALLAILFGAAVGNVVRGVPLDAAGNFQGSLLMALNPYAVVVGVLSLVLLAMHGANLLAAKTTDIQRARARTWAKNLWYPDSRGDSSGILGKTHRGRQLPKDAVLVRYSAHRGCFTDRYPDLSEPRAVWQGGVCRSDASGWLDGLGRSQSLSVPSAGTWLDYRRPDNLQRCRTEA